MSNFRRAKTKRFFLSASVGYFVFLALCVTVAGFVRQVMQSQPIDLRWLVPWVVSGLFVGFLFLSFQTWLEYRKRTFDPTWILKFQETFDSISKERIGASRCLLTNRERLSDLDAYGRALNDIDPVLDFLDDVGFYMSGDQISPEVVHHHFYHWIRGYWEASESYVRAWQRQEPARWNNLRKLYETVTEVEVRESHILKSQLLLKPEECKVFLEEEASLGSEEEHKESPGPASVSNDPLPPG